MIKKVVVYLVLLWALLLLGCSSVKCKKSIASDPIHITALNKNLGSANIGALRLKALSETAILVGAQGGLAWRSEQINCVLKRQQATLDQIYNFRSLMLKDDIKPPVLEEGRQELAQDGCESIRAADQVFRLVCPPCFVTAPPNWRDYIWMKFCVPESPDVTLLPRGKDEAAAWNCYISQGWQQGVEQANQIFAENLARLKRDFDGMLLYRKLLAQNMVTPPYVAKTELGVTGNGEELRINDRILRISATSQLNPNPDTWRPVVANPCSPPIATCEPPAEPTCIKIEPKCAKVIKKRPIKKAKTCRKKVGVR
jgi:defect in organelle trafficking protein DotC